MNKPKFKFYVATIGNNQQLAYVLDVSLTNKLLFRTGKIINTRQRYLIKKSKYARKTTKAILARRFWRYIGAQ